MEAQHDLLVVMDATGSMGSFLDGLNMAVPEILALSSLSGSFQRLGIISYYDYSDHPVLQWSGWNPDDLAGFAKRLTPDGGGDYPEAAKTALAKVINEADPNRNTLVLWYADAPPHSAGDSSSNSTKEKSAFPERSIDWVHLTQEALQKKCTVFSFISICDIDLTYYAYLSQITNGQCFYMEYTEGERISRLTLDVLLTWMGQPPINDPDNGILPFKHEGVYVAGFTPPPLIPDPIPTEESCTYLPMSSLTSLAQTDLLLTVDAIPQRQSSVSITLTSLGKRYSDPTQVDYRVAVVSSLKSIILHNVFALSYNPIFGQLWRAVCKENSIEKEELTNLFSQQIGQIKDDEKKKNMRAFVENSYDATEQIQEMINKAPAGGKRMYLDLDAMGQGGVDLTRMELLEVSRSCHSGVMAKLATIFTHAKIAGPDFVFGPSQRFIPLNLPPNQIFQLMPHLVVPGTMFSTRPAYIMAILSLIVGVPFLREIATNLVSKMKGHWIDATVPENISYEFARFILQGTPEEVSARLTEKEQAVYQGMRRYRLLELNMDSSLTAQVAWTPTKTRGVGDTKVECKICGVKRSKTMISAVEGFEGVCGICAPSETPKVMVPQEWKDEGDDESCWVECSVKTCRAQYVVVNIAGLRVRPKCWYCRNNKPCPYVECTRCKSRVVIPEYLRQGDEATSFLCIPCTTGSRPTIVDVETKARELTDDNGLGWLGVKNTPDTFSNKSAYKLFTAHTEDIFIPEPSKSSTPTLTLNQRYIHNTPSILSQINSRIASGTIEQGTCTLCFESAPHSKLFPACGRKGCHQLADAACLDTWYSHNKSGHHLNLTRFLCPFCRRKPAIKVLNKFNAPAATLGGLQVATEDRAWYYAWCGDCGFAKRAFERVCCEGETLPNVTAFRCEECIAAEAARRAAVGDATPVEGAQRVVHCPKCDVAVEKTFGCNHITCSCGTHWCFTCGSAFELDAIYTHMTEAHGGYYDDNGEEEEDDDYGFVPFD